MWRQLKGKPAAWMLGEAPTGDSWRASSPVSHHPQQTYLEERSKQVPRLSAEPLCPPWTVRAALSLWFRVTVG